MERTPSLIFHVSLLIIFVAVVNQTRADSCNDSLGTCTYEGVPPSPPSPLSPLKVCIGVVKRMCSYVCPEKCCDANCAQKYKGGRGFCNPFGNIILCQCQYPC
ncbi:PREDICTED: putative defensin-like protein 180 [Camelina sativa]|uniref:Defensin-like protein n=1 Tax=Camelina sativa TaxID=90675 RepID=A0ABM1QMS8_CAMSA|nr:PREDICTED: putative defensin-like protein 180 [Camelina sativa]